MIKLGFGVSVAALLGSAALASPLFGHYGGDDARLEVRADRISLELACGYASIVGPPRTDSHGNFTATGTYERTGAGPTHVDESGRGHPARFAGSRRGNRLMLIITPEAGEPVTLHLERNRSVKLLRCL